MKAVRFAGPFGFLAAVAVLYRLSPAGPCIVPLALLLTMLGASYIPDSGEESAGLRASRLLPVLYIPLQLGAIGWATLEVAPGHAGATAFLSLAISLGVCSGVFGVVAAHELIHSRIRWQEFLGAAMLTGIGYRHFRIAHIHGHHRFAATERDPSTARLGESFYDFFARTSIAQAGCTWQFEQRRLRGRTLPFLRNRLVQDGAIMTTLYSALLLLGWRAAAFLALESFIAVVVLELFNYVAHYGLMRRVDEPVRDMHSWNSAGAANLLIFNMGRHSHHHRAPSARYDSLAPAIRAPELPGGYAGGILLATIPPLWRKIMHRRLRALGTPAPESFYPAGAEPAAVAP